MNNHIGVLHPGQMGVYIAANLIKSGNKVYWVSAGRSEKTRHRAEQHKLIEVPTLSELCSTCSVIVSVCPPTEAEAVAHQVLSCSFQGTYIDANAINPKRSYAIGEILESKGITFVDGGIVGNPAWNSGSTSLYLSGKSASRIAALFPEGRLQVHILGDEIGKASAMKMCYAAYTKGTSALLCGILALAEENGVRAALEQEWASEDNQLDEKAKRIATRVTAKAWRFTGEMEEIAATFADASLPDGFHKAASEIFKRLSHFKDREEFPSLTEVLNALRNK